MKKILQDSIKMHYDNEDYTEVVRDALLCLMTEIRIKSDLLDSDGVDLINKAFSDSKPLIKINKLQTQSEKNKQRGVADLSKGFVEYFRNPMSHGKQNYTKDIADAILVLIDKVLLEEISISKGINSVEGWYNEITNEFCPNTQRYAKELIGSIPKNKRYDLAVLLYNNREKIDDKKSNLIFELINSLSDVEFKEFCEIVENDFYGVLQENDLVNTLKYASEKVWNNFKILTKTKIEDMILDDAKKMKIDFECDNYGNEVELQQIGGNILYASKALLEFLNNKKEIAEIIYGKLVDDRNNEYEFDYLLENYSNLIIEECVPEYDFIDLVYDRMRYKNKPEWYDTFRKILKKYDENNIWFQNFSALFNIKSSSSNEEIPF